MSGRGCVGASFETHEAPFSAYTVGDLHSPPAGSADSRCQSDRQHYCHPAMIDAPWTWTFRSGSAPVSSSLFLDLVRCTMACAVALLGPDVTSTTSRAVGVDDPPRQAHALSCKPWRTPCLLQSIPVDVGRGAMHPHSHYNGRCRTIPSRGSGFLSMMEAWFFPS